MCPILHNGIHYVQFCDSVPPMSLFRWIIFFRTLNYLWESGTLWNRILQSSHFDCHLTILWRCVLWHSIHLYTHLYFLKSVALISETVSNFLLKLMESRRRQQFNYVRFSFFKILSTEICWHGFGCANTLFTVRSDMWKIGKLWNAFQCHMRHCSIMTEPTIFLPCFLFLSSSEKRHDDFLIPTLLWRRTLLSWHSMTDRSLIHNR